MRSFVLLLLGFLLGPAPLQAQDQPLDAPQTRAEASDFTETTRYAGVRAFLDRLGRSSDAVHVTTFGFSMEGRALPLAVWGHDGRPEAEAIRRSAKTRVLILGNIHAGEVCGKEAALMLLRNLVAGQHAAWADSLVLLVAPIYNADGNERIRLDHRRYQNGPTGGMGQRPNAQGYDLNRDFMKADAPETRALLHLLADYDPHVLIDLHTTNGTHHGYHLTYAPPLHPDTPAAIDTLLRRHWLPAVTERMQADPGVATYYYGNVPRPGMDVPRGWYTFDHRPRFGTNYMGLRNRFAILSEAYAYASFEERVLTTKRFVEHVLEEAYQRATAIRRATERAERQAVAGRPLALAARHERSEPVEILMGAVRETRHPFTGAPVFQRVDSTRIEVMPGFGTFAATDSLEAPAAYLVPPDLVPVIDRLQVHDVPMEVLPEATTLTVEQFGIDSVEVAERTYQGHRAVQVQGNYATAEVTVPAGTVRVPTNSPRGRLAFFLLEPQADDGLLRWGLLEDEVAAGAPYPVFRVPHRTDR
ncbi:MAG: peptidase M14 [Bacteroidetes bacterium]|jgi:hypothetical protein|nr:peptidase M14 [Bacteroidota bacterium]